MCRFVANLNCGTCLCVYISEGHERNAEPDLANCEHLKRCVHPYMSNVKPLPVFMIRMLRICGDDRSISSGILSKRRLVSYMKQNSVISGFCFTLRVRNAVF